MQLLKYQPVEADCRADLKRQELHQVFRQDAPRQGQNDVTVGQVMTPNPLVVPRTVTAAQLVNLFQEHRFRHFLVADQGKLVGVLSDRDVIRLFGTESFAERQTLEAFTAGELMSEQIVSVTPQTRLRDAVSLLVSATINCLPVVEDGYPVGILTGTDLFLTLEQILIALDE